MDSATITNSRWRLFSGVLLILASLALFCFNPSEYHFYPVCVFHQVTGLLCPGCGALRAFHQLLHGNLCAAFRFNSLVILSSPLILGGLALASVRNRGKQSLTVSNRALWQGAIVFLLISVAFGVWRNLPGCPLARLPG